jgi:two-component sensor histidine kinase
MTKKLSTNAFESLRKKIHFHVGNLPRRLGQDVEIALFRIIQESLTNAIKYAHTENIHVNLIPQRAKEPSSSPLRTTGWVLITPMSCLTLRNRAISDSRSCGSGPCSWEEISRSKPARAKGRW